MAMNKKRTLKTITDEVIRESESLCNAEEILTEIKTRWRRKIAPATLDRLRQGLDHHQYLIGVDENDYLPYPAVMERLDHIALCIPMGKMELQRHRFFPGHRLVPFISHELKESQIIFKDPEGRDLPRLRESFLIEEVLHYYQYSASPHFPNDIHFNEGAPGKSSLTVPVWDFSEFLANHPCKTGDLLKVRLLDYEHGIFEISVCPKAEWCKDRLRNRAQNIALEKILEEHCDNPLFEKDGLEKQLLRGLLSLQIKSEEITAIFNFTEFIESVESLTLLGGKEEGVRLAPMRHALPNQYLCEEAVRQPKGEMGSLKAIFDDLGLAVNADEFKAILYTIMGSENYQLESVFDLIFGGEGKLFYDKKQHAAFYQHLRELLLNICEDLKKPESQVVTQLRDQAVGAKLRLIALLRYLEKKDLGLKDLPVEILEHIVDIDHFCGQALESFADRDALPQIKILQDTRLALKIVDPHLSRLEEDIYHRLDVY
jgi:hypothetical protein